MQDAIHYTNILLHGWTDEKARCYLEESRWPSGKIQCPRCGSRQPIYKQKRKDVAGYYRCPNRHKSRSNKDGSPDRPLVFTFRTDTILTRSHVPLAKWLYCLTLFALAPKRSLTPSKVSGLIGVDRKTASSILKLIGALRYETIPNEANNQFLLAVMSKQQVEADRLKKMQVKYPSALNPHRAPL